MTLTLPPLATLPAPPAPPAPRRHGAVLRPSRFWPWPSASSPRSPPSPKRRRSRRRAWGRRRWRGSAPRSSCCAASPGRRRRSPRATPPGRAPVCRPTGSTRASAAIPPRALVPAPAPYLSGPLDSARRDGGSPMSADGMALQPAPHWIAGARLSRGATVDRRRGRAADDRRCPRRVRRRARRPCLARGGGGERRGAAFARLLGRAGGGRAARPRRLCGSGPAGPLAGRPAPALSGDAMLLAGFGLVLGPTGLAWTLGLGCALALAHRACIQWRRRRPMRRGLTPFGPGLAAGAGVVFLMLATGALAAPADPNRPERPLAATELPPGPETAQERAGRRRPLYRSSSSANRAPAAPGSVPCRFPAAKRAPLRRPRSRLRPGPRPPRKGPGRRRSPLRSARPNDEPSCPPRDGLFPFPARPRPRPRHPRRKEASRPRRR